MDAANVDLKAFTDAFYHRLCFAQLQPVLDTLKYLRHETNVWFEVTTLLIPGENDSDAELHLAAEWFVENLGTDVPWHFTAFHPDFKMLDKPHTPAGTLTRAREIARSKGFHYVYTGNMHDREGGSTWCPDCGGLLIERDWYELGEWNIQSGRCRSCSYEIAGRFEDERGDWGARRLPVKLADSAKSVGEEVCFPIDWISNDETVSVERLTHSLPLIRPAACPSMSLATLLLRSVKRLPSAFDTNALQSFARYLLDITALLLRRGRHSNAP